MHRPGKCCQYVFLSATRAWVATDLRSQLLFHAAFTSNEAVSRTAAKAPLEPLLGHSRTRSWRQLGRWPPGIFLPRASPASPQKTTVGSERNRFCDSIHVHRASESHPMEDTCTARLIPHRVSASPQTPLIAKPQVPGRGRYTTSRPLTATNHRDKFSSSCQDTLTESGQDRANPGGVRTAVGRRQIDSQLSSAPRISPPNSSVSNQERKPFRSMRRRIVGAVPSRPRPQ
ncbi:MAG: hypothetical protein KatS3mg077_0810 [Candidatus Binatia bacterium]|nr:MAG: hypothetical protein KatS3mg077_0810 [Candidatus Binatia bacterium]